MAATWTIDFTVTNLAEKRVNVTATRTDGEDVWTKTLPRRFNDDENKVAFLTRIKNTFQVEYSASLALASQYEALLSDWADLIKAALESEEA